MHLYFFATSSKISIFILNIYLYCTYLLGLLFLFIHIYEYQLLYFFFLDSFFTIGEISLASIIIPKIKQLITKINKKCEKLPSDNFYHKVVVDYIEYTGDCQDINKQLFQKKLSKNQLKVLTEYKPLNNKVKLSCPGDFSIIADLNPKTIDTVNTKKDKGFSIIKSQDLFKIYGLNTQTQNLCQPNGVSRFYGTHNPYIYF